VSSDTKLTKDTKITKGNGEAADKQSFQELMPAALKTTLAW